MPRILWFVISLLVLSSPAMPQQAEESTPPSPQETLEKIREEHNLPGMAVMGLTHGQVKFSGCVGQRSSDHQEKVEIGDLWHLGSCAKSMTATMIARLVEEEELFWDTTIVDAFPDLQENIHPGFHEVTVLELLQHRGGIAERADSKRMALTPTLSALKGHPVDLRRKAISIVLKEEPSVKPGTSPEYSNFGYMVAAAMAEEVMGMTWRELMTAYVFEPLELSTGGFCLPGSPESCDQPRGHREEDEKLISLSPTRENDLPECYAPAGLIHMSLADWGKYLVAHNQGVQGKGDFLTKENFAILQTPPEGLNYACGWGISQRSWSPDGTVLSHNGSNGTWMSVCWISPSGGIAAMATTNCAHTQANQALDQAIQLALVEMGVLPKTR